MKDFFESVWQQVKDRMSSPIFGAFFIAWLCWNHQYLVILFSDLPVEARFNLARVRLYPTETELWWRCLWWPLFSTLGYIVVYPPASIVFLMYWDRLQAIISNLRNKAQGNKLLTRAESDALRVENVEVRRKIREMEVKHEQEIEALRRTPAANTAGRGESTNELVQLRDRNAVVENELKRLNDQLSPQNPLGRFPRETVRGVEELLKILAKLPGDDSMLESEALQRLKLNPLHSRHVLDKALEAQVVFRQGSNNAVFLRLNERGREYVVMHKLVE